MESFGTIWIQHGIIYANITKRVNFVIQCKKYEEMEWVPQCKEMFLKKFMIEAGFCVELQIKQIKSKAKLNEYIF